MGYETLRTKIEAIATKDVSLLFYQMKFGVDQSTKDLAEQTLTAFIVNLLATINSLLPMVDEIKKTAGFISETCQPVDGVLFEKWNDRMDSAVIAVETKVNVAK